MFKQISNKDTNFIVPKEAYNLLNLNFKQKPIQKIIQKRCQKN